ncbi:FKBP-type peptidyl-prolyl cis-trans isomerase [Spirosoma pomorum]|jgi:FKBP-type peptidyl-prolyl cis-trans isomerase FklB
MKFNQWTLAGVTSAVLLAGTVSAQVKKPATSKSTSTARSTAAKPAAPATSATTIKSSGAAIKSSQDSISYSIGLFMAQNLKQQGMTDLNNALLTKGLEDALAGQKTQISMDQAGQLLQAYSQKQYAARNEEMMKASAENKKVGTAFLTENKAKAGVVTTPSGLQYSVEKEGTGAKPTATDRVKVHYTGKLLDGKVFDSSVERGQPAEFGVNEVIKGWTEALQLMPVGSKWKLYIPSDLAYGDRGAGQDIKPGSTLVFDVELLDIVKQ